ncbi:hypothetical protein [Aquimarina sp. AU474]|uniref:hypothetical protein n=1 Tax=Aquimarina sp. AU474 TaxID=2108529 RepID=UPI0013575A08|nr:hypothetical protein [Aquimarina sp. AU474]
MVLGFFLSIANYGIRLVNFYTCSDEIAVMTFDETENSEKKEKENSEKEEFKQKDKISQFYDENSSSLVYCNGNLYPDFYLKNISVYLEENTPPPEFS